MSAEEHFPPTHAIEAITVPYEKLAKYNLPFIMLPLLMFLIYMINYGAENLIYAIQELKDIYRLSILLIGGIFVHEMIHMVSWSILSGYPLRIFRVGFKWQLYIPYVFSIEPMPARAFKIGLLVPFVLMGAIPLGFAFYYENLLLLLFGLIFSMWASGDLLLFVLLIKVPSKYLLNVHHEKFGCLVFKPI